MSEGQFVSAFNNQILPLLPAGVELVSSISGPSAAAAMIRSEFRLPDGSSYHCQMTQSGSERDDFTAGQLARSTANILNRKIRSVENVGGAGI